MINKDGSKLTGEKEEGGVGAWLSEKVYSNLLNNLPGMFYRCLNDEFWTMTHVSRGCEGLTGYKPEELQFNTHISYEALIHPMDKNWLREMFNYSLGQKIQCNCEYRIICRKGKIRWVRELANGIYDEKGNLKFIEGYIQEITGEKCSSMLSNAFSSYQNAINSGSIVSLTDINGNIIFANDHFCHYSKYSRQELVGKNHNIVNSGYHSKAFFADLWKTILGGKIWRGEIRNKAKDGSYYWVDTVISPVNNEEGKIEQFLSIRNIISEKKQIEEELINSKQKYKQIVENISDAIVIEDASGKPVFYNKQFTRMFGVTNEDFLLPELIAPPFKSAFDEKRLKVLEGKLDSAVMETEAVRPDGVQCIFELRITPVLENVKISGLLFVFRDITENKNYIQKLKELGELNRRIISSSKDLFYVAKIKDSQTLINPIIFVSEPSEHFFGLSTEKLINEPGYWVNTIHPDDLSIIESSTNKLFEKKESVSRIYRITNNNHQDYIWVYEYFAPMLDESGAVTEIYGSLKDITELKNKEMQLEGLVRELSGKYNEMMQFNFVVSHHLRAPIATILGLTNLFNMPGLDAQEMKQVIEHIRQTSNRMDSMVKDLNQILAARSAINTKKEKVDLFELIPVIEACFEEEIKKTGAVIVTNFAENARRIFSIRSYWKSILFNLVSNSIKFRSPSRTPEIMISTLKKNDNLNIYVSDNGMGMDLKSYGHQVFGLYKKFHSDAEGKGLGLYMVKTQVEALGGRISVKSDLGKGTTFRISIPLQ